MSESHQPFLTILFSDFLGRYLERFSLVIFFCDFKAIFEQFISVIFSGNYLKQFFSFLHFLKDFC